MDVLQECFVVGSVARLAEWAHAEATWAALWPGLVVTVDQDRGSEGVRATVSGALVGSAEIWLEPYGDGVIVHCYLRADGSCGPLPAGCALRRKRTWQRHLSGQLWSLKDRIEAGREPGTGCTSGARSVKPPPAGADI